MDRCERRSRPLDRGAEFNGEVGTRNRSRSKQDDVGIQRKKKTELSRVWIKGTIYTITSC